MISVRFYDCDAKETFCYMEWDKKHLSKGILKIIVSELHFAVDMVLRKRVVADIFLGKNAIEIMKGRCPYTGDITVSIIDFKEKYGCATVFINCNEILREFQLI